MNEDKKTIPLFLLILLFLMLFIVLFAWFGVRKGLGPVISPPISQPPIVSPPASEPTVPQFYPQLITEYDTATVGEPLDFIWTIDAPEETTTSHTAIHWDIASHPGDFGLDAEPPQGYQNQELITDTLDLPNVFNTKITFSDPGTYYYRVHALINDQNYWTKEYSLEVE